MGLLSLFAAVVFAAESVISPIPDGTPVVVPPPPKPAVSFGQISYTAPEVLGVTETVTPAPTPTPPPTGKKSYIIAFLGDSMIDTLGPGLPAVASRLKSEYPGTDFTLLNYGVGGTNIEYGIQRITNNYNYLGNDIAALESRNPNIVVLESFAYNPFPDADGGINRHWIALGNAVSTLKTAIPGVKIMIAATIAPNSKVFGDGAAGIAFGEMDKIQRTEIIKAYLDSTVKFATGEHLPLVDVYHASMDGSGDGLIQYINPGDHIHYSDAGRSLFAQKFTDALVKSRLLE